MNSTLVFTLMMFLPNGNTQIMATFPTHEACIVEAARVAGEIKNMPDITQRVGVACVPTNQFTLNDVQRQMTNLMQIMKNFDRSTGKVDDCDR